MDTHYPKQKQASTRPRDTSMQCRIVVFFLHGGRVFLINTPQTKATRLQARKFICKKIVYFIPSFANMIFGAKSPCLRGKYTLITGFQAFYFSVLSNYKGQISQLFFFFFARNSETM